MARPPVSSLDDPDGFAEEPPLGAADLLPGATAPSDYEKEKKFRFPYFSRNLTVSIKMKAL